MHFYEWSSLTYSNNLWTCSLWYFTFKREIRWPNFIIILLHRNSLLIDSHLLPFLSSNLIIPYEVSGGLQLLANTYINTSYKIKSQTRWQCISCPNMLVLFSSSHFLSDRFMITSHLEIFDNIVTSSFRWLSLSWFFMNTMQFRQCW